MKKKQSNRDTLLMLDYYQRPLILLHQEGKETQEEYFLPHPIRDQFWKLVPYDNVDSEKARELLNSYLISIEAELKKCLDQYSLAYCMHLYRRLSPGPIGFDQQPITIGLTRAALEAAFQKYTRSGLCERIAESASIPIDEVFNGLLMSDEFELERNIIAQGNQLVLANFDSNDLRRFYDLERLAYEIWRTAAALRITGKGAPLVLCGQPDSFVDNRSEDLDFLVNNYDQRHYHSSLAHSAAGVEYSNPKVFESKGLIMLPLYNIGGVTSENYKELLLAMYNIKFQAKVTFNFAWFPFNLKDYRKAHLPFAVPFGEKYGVLLDAVLVVIAALAIRMLVIWERFGVASFTRFHQRGYEGPITYQLLQEDIMMFIPSACSLLEIDESNIKETDVLSAIKFWELDTAKRDDIDLSYSGPHYVFLPIKDAQYFIDYAWIYRRLYSLFVGVWIPDQNFKGLALENALKQVSSTLPTNPCKAINGEERQIDYAVSFDKYLLIAECKAVGTSIGFERGNPESIKYRIDNVVDLSLTQVDEKAAWLADNPIGTNYDISSYEYILPIGVSPFIEYIPSKEKKYWISDTIPRVLSVNEFKELISDKNNIVSSYNLVTIVKED